MSVPNLKWIIIIIIIQRQLVKRLNMALNSFKSYKGGPKISKLDRVTISHAHIDPETLNLCRHPSIYPYLLPVLLKLRMMVVQRSTQTSRQTS